jgi:dTDP-4-amino-4,6-dideoxygalactose transaminase
MTKIEYDHPTAFSHWGDEERDAIHRVLASGRLTMGPETEAFEDELAVFNHRRYCIVISTDNCGRTGTGLGHHLCTTVSAFHRIHSS